MIEVETISLIYIQLYCIVQGIEEEPEQESQSVGREIACVNTSDIAKNDQNEHSNIDRHKSRQNELDEGHAKLYHNPVSACRALKKVEEAITISYEISGSEESENLKLRASV